MLHVHAIKKCFYVEELQEWQNHFWLLENTQPGNFPHDLWNHSRQLSHLGIFSFPFVSLQLHNVSYCTWLYGLRAFISLPGKGSMIPGTKQCLRWDLRVAESYIMVLGSSKTKRCSKSNSKEATTSAILLQLNSLNCQCDLID